MKRWLTKNTLIKSIGVFVIFSILIIGVSAYLIYNEAFIGPAYVLLAFLGMGVIKLSSIDLKAVYPDIMFGVIDNGFLIFAAVFGGELAGVPGAVLGGAAGNTITDGFGGIIEGKIAEKLKNDHYEENRNSYTTMMGKVIGCLLGAGMSLTIVWFLNFIWAIF